MKKQKTTSSPCFRRWSRKGYSAFTSLNKVIKIGVITFTCSLVQAEYQQTYAKQEANISSNVNLNEIEISASPRQLKSAETRIIGVIEKKEIEAAALHSINDILKILPSVDIRQRGVDDVQADISIRGGSFDQTLILLNGVNISDSQTGHLSLDLPIDFTQIKKIEILQGSDARLSGPNAFSGAINIITYDKKEGNNITFEQALGSYGKTKTNIGITHKKGNFSIDGSAGYKQSDGYIHNTDYKIFNSFFRTSYKSSKVGLFQYQAGIITKDYGANGFYTLAYPNQAENTKTLFTSLDWAKYLNNFKLSANIYERRHHDKFELFRDNKDENGNAAPSWYKNPNYHITDSYGGRILGTYYSTLGKTTIGIDLRDEHIYSNVLGNAIENKDLNKIDDIFDKDAFFTKEKNRINTRLFFEQSMTFDKLSLSLGASANNNSDFDFDWFGGVDLGYSLTNKLTAYLSYNRAIRIPTFTDLYYSSRTQIGNSNLSPEKSGTTELSVKYVSNKLSFDVASWYRDGKNIIDWVKNPDSTKWEAKNLTKVKAYGFDLNLKYKFENKIINSIGIAYSYQDLDKSMNNLDSKYALDYLRNKFNLNADFTLYQFNKNSNLGLNLNYGIYDRAGSYTNVNNTLTSYDTYDLINSRLKYTYKKYSLYIDLNNILDKDYCDIGGLTQPGLNFISGIQLIF